ncbi:MAG: DNA polymerase/3'-5' exonuclease PolX [Nitrosopumilaceae archaeon]
MKNSEISKVLAIIGLYENLLNGGFKARAYDNANRVVDSLSEEISIIYERGGLDEILKIPGIGQGIGKKIEEMLTTGKSKHLENLKKKIPVDVEELMGLEGVGPKSVKTLWQKLKIKSISELEEAARSHKIQEISGFGEKSEQDIIRSIEFYKKHKGRFLIGQMFPVLKEIEKRLAKIPGVKKAILCGSSRRMKETIGDGDFLVQTNNPKKVIDFFTSMPEIIHVYSSGKTKTFVKLDNGLDVDLQIVTTNSFGAASQYFTGNKEHNIRLRKISNEKGWKLNEYGMFKGDKFLYGKTEEEIYQSLGMEWIPPEMRENVGEIELAQKKKIPKLIKYDSLKGDLQMHSTWSDGEHTISDMANAAKQFGLEYIAITDHSKRLSIAGGIDEKQLEKQSEEIDKINQNIDGIKVLKGTEVDILKDGSLDFSNDVLSKLDIVGASIHSHFNLSKKEQTKRVLKVLENPQVNILFHPTSRLIQKREPCDLDMDLVCDKAKQNNVILEIDASAGRLDLKDDHIRFAKSKGCRFVIDSDAHSPEEFEFLRLGVGQARRGWLEKKDVINTNSLEKFLRLIKK